MQLAALAKLRFRRAILCNCTMGQPIASRRVEARGRANPQDEQDVPGSTPPHDASTSRRRHGWGRHGALLAALKIRDAQVGPRGGQL